MFLLHAYFQSLSKNHKLIHVLTSTELYLFSGSIDFIITALILKLLAEIGQICMIWASNAGYRAGRGVIPTSFFLWDLKIVLSGSKLITSGYASKKNVISEYF